MIRALHTLAPLLLLASCVHPHEANQPDGTDTGPSSSSTGRVNPWNLHTVSDTGQTGDLEPTTTGDLEPTTTGDLEPTTTGDLEPTTDVPTACAEADEPCWVPATDDAPASARVCCGRASCACWTPGGSDGVVRCCP